MSIYPCCKHEWTDANFNCPQCETEDELTALRARVAELEAAMHQAVEWMADDGCDCGEDEPGSCALCRCAALLKLDR